MLALFQAPFAISLKEKESIKMSKIKRIDLFTFPHSQQYGVQQAFSEGLQKSLQRLKVASSLYPYKELGSGQIIADLIKNAPDCTAGFNVTVAKHSPLEPLGLPHVAMIVDSATYFPELLQTPNAIVSFVEEDSVGFFKMLGAKHVFHFPHAIDADLLEAQNGPRDLDVVMCGSFIDSDEILATWNTLLSPYSVARLLEVAEKVLASASISHLQAFVELVEERGAFEKELVDKSIEFFDLMNSLDQYIRGVDRRRILEAIDRPVHVFGAKKYEELWKKSIKDFKKLVFHDEVPFAEIKSVLKRAKVVLNSFPMFKRGLHERMLTSLACGASVLGNDNVYVQSEFGSSPLAILNILSPNYNQVNMLIDAALKNEEARFDAVVATHDTIRSKHTWDVRARMLLEILPPMLDEIRKNNPVGISHLFAKGDES